MSQVGIENGKKGLPFWPVFPVGIAAALVPPRRILVYVIVLLAVVGDIVPRVFQILRIDLHMRGKRCLATHVLPAERGWIHSCDEYRTSGAANGSVSVGVLVQNPLSRETVDGRCLPMWVAVAS